MSYLQEVITHPDLYATVGTAIYVAGAAREDSPFKDAPLG